MINRLLDPLTSSSYFLFGARGTGKSTYLNRLSNNPKNLYIDLLDPENESMYSLDPVRLRQEILARKSAPPWVIIDEIQKVPKLLDIVHSLIESRKQKFILTGSSARKLRRGAANLLAGRANVYHLYPFSYLEIEKNFELDNALRWGLLPKLSELKSDREKKAYLNSYIQTYFAEEIRAEQLIRKLDPFRAFLPILGQVSGKIINHKKIASEIGTSIPTIQSYFQIVEDTLLGFYLPAFHESVRKSQRLSPKFFLFDTGVKKALEGSLDQIVHPRTSVFGELFESFLINEVIKLNSYFEKDFRLSYYATKNDVEVDLILSKNNYNIAVEIKSNSRVVQSEIHSLASKLTGFPNLKRVFYVSLDKSRLREANVECLHWSDFLKEFKTL